MECGDCLASRILCSSGSVKSYNRGGDVASTEIFLRFCQKGPHIFQSVASLFGQAIMLAINPKENVMKHIIKAVAAIVIAAGSLGNAAAQYTATTMGNTTFIHGPTGTTTATTMGNTTFIYGPLFPR